MASVVVSNGKPVTFRFRNGGVECVVNGVQAHAVRPSEERRPSEQNDGSQKGEQKGEQKEAAAARGDHSFTPERDMSPLTPSEEQSWSSGGTAGALPSERKTSTFDVKKMTEAIYGGPEQVARRQFVLAPQRHHVLKPLEKYDMSREAVMAAHHRDFIAIHKAFTKKGYRPTIAETGWMAATSTNSGSLTTHMGLFLPTIIGQASNQQKMLWVPRAMNFSIIGAYAQTELGHGSNVRALQTTAVYDAGEQCFFLNTPTLQSMKFWNSGAGLVATHCVCYAQLSTGGVNHGVHVFFVQLRDEHHRPLAGFEIGDCGNKLGDNGIDCGYIRMRDVRVPREHLLAKKAHVEPDGTYVRHTPAKGGDVKIAERLSYMTMLTARVHMITAAGGKLALGVTTGVRYGCVRRQGFVAASGVEERKIIDYPVQRYRLFKQLALSYAMQFAGHWMHQRFEALSKDLYQDPFKTADDDGAEKPPPDTSDLPEIHASAAGLKGLCTRLAADGLEECRKCCGGHGYLLAGGVAATWADYVWQATAEGDAVVMLLQTARFLVKTLAVARTGRDALPGAMTYLQPFRRNPAYDPTSARASAPRFTDASQHLTLADMLQHRALLAVYLADRHIESLKAGGMSKEQAWHAASRSLVAAAERHCYYVLYRQFSDSVDRVADGSSKQALRRVCTLYGLTQVHEGSGWAGIVDAGTAVAVSAAIEQVLAELRPDAVALVDAFDIPDRVLNSVLGRSDGNVYEALYANARDSSLNKTAPFAGFTEHLQPHLDAKFLALRGDAPEQLKKAMAPKKKKLAKL
ncbi:putative peroxisomal acyl-coenzyme A oxidase 1.2 [Diplonema papillatum]|nr:putative peroxisomal acyl-coenzyme A oxidase 1.2 [Diplonema papillatum]